MLLIATDLTAARTQMAFTLGTHIVLASMGVGFPTIMLIANYLGIRRGDGDALLLARRWSKVVAVTFAVGAVTGTVLSFEFGLLWPELFSRFGAVFGVPFAIEGIFFFTEAVFIAIYIYGWDHLSDWAHLWCGVPIAIAGIGGAFSVVAANSWMNQPRGFTLGPDGSITHADPFRAIFNPAAKYEVPHMILAAYMVAGFLAASVYAVGMLRGRRDRYHRLGLAIPFAVASLATPVQLLVGDTAARSIADDQPAKFAAMEYVTTTGTQQPEWVFGFYNNGNPRFGLKIPKLDSVLVGFSPNTKVTGLDAVPADQQPPAPTLLHWAFDIMVMVGTGLFLLACWFGWSMLRRRALPESRWFLRAASIAGAAAIAALECGWIVTEVGRQPWVVYKILRTSDAVTHRGGIVASLVVVVVLYTLIGVATVIVLRRMSSRWRHEQDVGVPYGPRSPAPAESTRA